MKLFHFFRICTAKSILSLACLLCSFAFAYADNNSVPVVTHSGGVAEVPELFIINSTNERFVWSRAIISSVREVSSKNRQFIVKEVHMNSSWITNDSIYDIVKEHVLSFTQGRRPFCLLLLGEMAFTLREELMAKWGNDIPMVFVSDNDTYAPKNHYYTPSEGVDTHSFGANALTSINKLRPACNFTFVESPSFYRATIDMMMKMMPGTQRFVFVADNLYFNRRLDQLIQSYLNVHYPEVTYERIRANADNISILQQRIQHRDLTTGMLFSSWNYRHQELMGNTIYSGNEELFDASQQPIFTLWRGFFNTGAFVGGCFANDEEINRVINKTIMRVLNGEQPREIPFYLADITSSIPHVSKARLLQCGLSETRCPQDVVFLEGAQESQDRPVWWLMIFVTLLMIGIMVYYTVGKIISNKKALNERNRWVRKLPVLYARTKATFDTEGNVVDLNLLYCNEPFESIISPLSGGFTDQKKGFIDKVNQAREEGRPVTSVYSLANGRVLEFIYQAPDADGVVDVFGMDATRQVVAESSLTKVQRKLHLMADRIKVLAFRWDIANKVVIFDAPYKAVENFNLTRLTGSTESTQIFSAEEFLGNIYFEERGEFKQAVDSFSLGKQKNKEFSKELRLATKEGLQNGNQEWAEVVMFPDQSDECGIPAFLLGFIHFITDRKKYEMALVDAVKKAENSEQMKSAYLANMSHEIRTPLNSIIGFSSLLASTEDPAEKKEYSSLVEYNGQLLLQLIDDVLDLAKIESNTVKFDYREVDLNALLHNVGNTIQGRLHPGVKLECLPGEVALTMNTDSNRLSQILINFLTNAAKFTKKGFIRFGYELRGDKIYLFVTDTGRGISPEEQETVFRRFVKLDSDQAGSGLGLSISKHLTERMGGEIGMHSAGIGRGSTFWVLLPFGGDVPVNNDDQIEEVNEKTEEERAQTVVTQTISKSKNQATILVAEDNDNNYLLFKSILSKEYNLVHAKDGVEAVELFKEHQPNLVLMDISMPRMDGKEATREIRKISTTVPIIAVTAFAFVANKTEIMKNGFSDFLSKPINVQKLRDVVKGYLGTP